MKTFLIKAALFYVFLLPVFSYRFVSNNISGDLGNLGQIPFGKKYDNHLCDDSVSSHTFVFDIDNPDSIALYKVITVGDSFSQQGYLGYQQYLGVLADTCIGNLYRDDFYNPFNDYLALLNNGFFKEGQTVVIEVVERNIIYTAINMKFDCDSLPFLSHTQDRNTSNEDTNSSYLKKAFAFVRLRLGYNNPVYHYKLTSNLFSHPRYSDDLFVYDSDLINCKAVTDEDIAVASRNIDRAKELSHSKGINLYLLICPDKYDTYQPFVVKECGRLYSKGEFVVNDVLDRLPDRDFILCPKSEFRQVLGEGLKDLYKVNDTHFSPVGAQTTASYIYRFLTDL